MPSRLSVVYPTKHDAMLIGSNGGWGARITVAAIARGGGFDIFSHPGRIMMEAAQEAAPA